MKPKLAGMTLFLCGAVALAAQTTGGPGLGAAPLGIEALSGRESFEFYCAACHGRDGQGGGPVAAALKVTPGNLTTLARWNDGRFPREDVVAYVTGTGRTVAAHGAPDMPVWGPTFLSLDPSDARVKVRINNIVDFIESIQVK